VQSVFYKCFFFLGGGGGKSADRSTASSNSPELKAFSWTMRPLNDVPLDYLSPYDLSSPGAEVMLG
jgi:hypothetical protein